MGHRPAGAAPARVDGLDADATSRSGSSTSTTNLPSRGRYRPEAAAVDADDDLARAWRRSSLDEPVGHLVRRGPLDHRRPRRRRRRRADHGGTVALRRSMPILAHLDLDAFFAAVEELEDPTLRTKPLVVGGDPRGRGVVATANYVARRYGIRSAMSSAEALRRCPETIFVRPRHTLYREYSRAVWSCDRGGRPPGRADGDRRGLPRPRRRPRLVRRRATARPGGADGGARRDLAFVLAGRLDVEGRLQGRLGPTEAGRNHGRPARDGGTVPGAVPDPHPPRRRAPVGGAAERRGHPHDRKPRGA